MALNHLACLLALACTVAAQTPAKDLSDRITEKVLPMIDEIQIAGADQVHNFATQLGQKQELVIAAKDSTTGPDTKVSQCLLLENQTLHEWKVCNKTRQDKDCTDGCVRANETDISTYTIGESVDITGDNDEKLNYKPPGAAVPQAVCNFSTMKMSFRNDQGDLVQTDSDCYAFVADIKKAAKEKFVTDHSEHTTSKQACSVCKTELGQIIMDCIQKGKVYRSQKSLCTTNATQRQVKLCSFQTALKAKCSKLSAFNTALAELEVLDEQHNSELRTVSLSKCLFDRYNDGSAVCFNSSDTSPCMEAVNGQVAGYATTFAEQLRAAKDEAAGHLEPYPCKAGTITIGNDGVSYEKMDPADAFSYYMASGDLTFPVSETGALTPNPCR